MTEPRDGWIPVAEALPSVEELVWLCGFGAIASDVPEVTIGCLLDSGLWSDTNGEFWWAVEQYKGRYYECDIEVTHWMPLPKPPGETR